MFNYKEYFEQITPKTKEEVYNRFLFALCSVHTTWENNIRGYQYLKDKDFSNEEETTNHVKSSRLGMTGVRTKALIGLQKTFKDDWKIVLRNKDEDWKEYAKRIEQLFFGLGYAKSRFAIEMLYPNEAQIVCTDTHIIQWAKQSQKNISKSMHKKIEMGFINHSLKHKTPPVEMRWKMWDKKQGYDNPKYWTYVLE